MTKPKAVKSKRRTPQTPARTAPIMLSLIENDVFFTDEALSRVLDPDVCSPIVHLVHTDADDEFVDLQVLNARRLGHRSYVGNIASGLPKSHEHLEGMEIRFQRFHVRAVWVAPPEDSLESTAND